MPQFFIARNPHSSVCFVSPWLYWSPVFDSISLSSCEGPRSPRRRRSPLFEAAGVWHGAWCNLPLMSQIVITRNPDTSDSFGWRALQSLHVFYIQYFRSEEPEGFVVLLPPPFASTINNSISTRLPRNAYEQNTPNTKSTPALVSSYLSENGGTIVERLALRIYPSARSSECHRAHRAG